MKEGFDYPGSPIPTPSMHDNDNHPQAHEFDDLFVPPVYIPLYPPEPIISPFTSSSERDLEATTGNSSVIRMETNANEPQNIPRIESEAGDLNKQQTPLKNPPNLRSVLGGEPLPKDNSSSQIFYSGFQISPQVADILTATSQHSVFTPDVLPSEDPVLSTAILIDSPTLSHEMRTSPPPESAGGQCT